MAETTTPGNVPSGIAAGALDGSLAVEICDELDSRASARLSDEVRETVAFFVDHLAAALTLGTPDALTDQLGWQRRRLGLLAPVLDVDDLVTATRLVVSRRLADAPVVSGSRGSRDRDEAQLDAALGHLAARTRPDEVEDLPDAAFGEQAARYLELALGGRDDAAVDYLLASGLSANDLLLRVLEPAQTELGRRWEHDHVSVAEEHETTALTQRVMSLLRDRRKPTVPHGRSVLAGVVGDELHGVGLDMVVDLLAGEGWAVHRVPGTVRADEVVEEVLATSPDVVALSVTLFKHVVELRSVIEALRADARTRDVPVVVGGRPFRLNPALAELVGADEWAADGEGALEACRRFADAPVIAQQHLGDVTHEMVQPLETMLGMAALLQEDDSLSHRQRDLAQRIIRAGGQLMSVLEDLGHGLVVVQGGRDERSSAGLIDLDELVESVLVRHQGRAAQRDIVVRQIRIPPHRGRVMVDGDVSQLERVIDKLLDNAVSVTPASGVITVRVKRADGQVAVAVADEGPPVPREFREAIFDADRATSSTGATDVGPWRGLAVCRRIAEQHGGTVTAASDHRGSVFTLDLPLSPSMLHHEPPITFPTLSVVRDRQVPPA